MAQASTSQDESSEMHNRELMHICDTVRTSALGARIDFKAMQVHGSSRGHCADAATQLTLARALPQAWMPSCTHELISDVLSVCVSLHMVEDVVGPGPQDNYVWRGTEDTHHAVVNILKHAHANPHLLSGQQLDEDDANTPVTACGQRSDMALVCERLLLHLAARGFGGRDHQWKQGGEQLELGPIAAKLRPQLAPFIPGRSILPLLQDVAFVLECFGCAHVPAAGCDPPSRAHRPGHRPARLL